MKWTLICAMMVFAAGCLQEMSYKDAPTEAAGIYNARIEGDFLGLDVNDSDHAIVDPYFQAGDPGYTQVHISGRAGDQQAMHIVWIDDDISTMPQGHYEYDVGVDNFDVSQPAGVDVCQIDNQGATTADKPATHFDMDIDLVPGGRDFAFSATLLAEDGSTQVSRSGFRLIE